MTNPKKAYYEGKTVSPGIVLKAFSAFCIISLLVLSLTVWIVKVI